MKEIYQSELEWMQDFYKELGLEPVYSLNTDGKINWNLLEFKLNFTNLNAHKNQVKRYIQAYNSGAYEIPKYSYLISLNTHEYIKIDNENNVEITSWNRTSPSDFKLELLNQCEYIKWRIDEYSIVSYNNKLCAEFKSHFKSKEDVKNEFISPHFLNIKPFERDKQMEIEESNKNEIGRLHFNMNMLWPNLLKKQLWAFFTPDRYVKISTEMVREAIKRVPEWNDYIILDRCAWTWDLEKFLTEEELSHCVLNTIDYTEWTTLKWLYEWRAKMIIPPTHKTLTEQWLLRDWDALSEEFHNYKPLNDLINNEKITVILLENPPYSDINVEKTKTQKAFFFEEMWKETYKHTNNTKNINREICNQFIWSWFKYYLRQQTDQAIIYSPIKYWKSQNLVDKKFIRWYICNREHFNANEWWISLIHWENIDTINEELQFQSDLGDRKLKKIHSTILENAESWENWYACFTSLWITPNPLRWFLIQNWDYIFKTLKNKPYWLNNENVLQQLPLRVANCYECEDYTEKDVIMKSADWWNKYQEDSEFLKSCFIWACISQRNKCISDWNLKNELCFKQNTQADEILIKQNLDKEDMYLINLRTIVLNEAKNKEEYNDKRSYWLYQLDHDINLMIWTWTFDKTWKEKMAPKYLVLDSKIKQLKEWLKNYYRTKIKNKLFEYELLK